MTESRTDLLNRGLRAVGERAWREGYDCLARADRQEGLEPAILDRAAMAAYLVGRDDECVALLARTHQAYLAAGEPAPAVRSAFWIAFVLIHRGDMASASGWLSRARRLLNACGQDSVERGYLLLPAALAQVTSGEIDAAMRTFAEAAAIGERFHEPDLVSLARQGRGRTLIRLGSVDEGMVLLDEVMVSVTANELSPIVAGTVYCSVISACIETFDLRRAREWTEALTRWCAAQPDLVPYRGQCLVYRAEVMAFGGVWTEAIDQARRACDALATSANRSVTGAAFYQLAELYRLRGDTAAAEEAYRRAGELGRSPQPGLALLRLAQGRVDDARAAICRFVGELRDKRVHTDTLAAFVDILLEAGDMAAARGGADELARVAGAVDRPVVRARAAHASGSVLLRAGDAAQALRPLRDAVELWRQLEVPYEAARTTVLVATACRALGDSDSADIELAAARRAFEELSAAPDLARLERLVGGAPTGLAGLTARELQVLRVLASGKTNRAIADELGISEKTVARHISNIFTKLDLPSRAAATAYAFQHGML